MYGARGSLYVAVTSIGLAMVVGGALIAYEDRERIWPGQRMIAAVRVLRSSLLLVVISR
jgi:hypothetical protein